MARPEGPSRVEVLLLGGQPIREPIAAYGPFVMNHRSELVQAVEDFQAGRLGTVPADGLRPYRGRAWVSGRHLAKTPNWASSLPTAGGDDAQLSASGMMVR